MPRSRDEVREYFAGWRPRLAASEAAQKMMHFLLDGPGQVLPKEGALGMTAPALSKMIRTGTIATMPQYMRALANLRQSKAKDAAAITALRPGLKVLASNLSMYRKLFSHVAPTSLPFLEPYWYGVEPVEPVVRTPAEARKLHGYVRPAEAHLEWRAKQETRVFGEGQTPSDAGISESESTLGALA